MVHKSPAAAPGALSGPCLVGLSKLPFLACIYLALLAGIVRERQSRLERQLLAAGGLPAAVMHPVRIGVCLMMHETTVHPLRL